MLPDISQQIETETHKTRADAFFAENQALESKVRKAQRGECEALAERDKAVATLEKQQEKSKRDSDKIINLKARFEALENRHLNETNALKRENDRAVRKQGVLQEQMMELMEKWEEQTQARADQKELVIGRANRMPGEPTYGELQGIIKKLTQQHLIDMDDLARERRVKATLAAQLDMVSGQRYGWPHKDFDPEASSTTRDQKPAGAAAGGRPTTTTEKVWIERLFKTIDADGSGFLDLAEFKMLIQKFAPDQAPYYHIW